MKTLHRLRMRLAEWLAPEGYLVLHVEVFETLLDINAAYANRRIEEAMRVVPLLFESSGRKETRH